MTLTTTIIIIHPCEDDYGRHIPVGTVVDYLGHVPGGMVTVNWGANIGVIHPAATKELSVTAKKAKSQPKEKA